MQHVRRARDDVPCGSSWRFEFVCESKDGTGWNRMLRQGAIGLSVSNADG